MSSGTGLNIDHGIVAAHPSRHATALEDAKRCYVRRTHLKWLEAVINSGIATGAALEHAANSYETSKDRVLVPLMETTAAASHCQLSEERQLTLIGIFGQGPAAIQRAVAEQTLLPAEVDGILSYLRMLMISLIKRWGFLHRAASKCKSTKDPHFAWVLVACLAYVHRVKHGMQC